MTASFEAYDGRISLGGATMKFLADNHIRLNICPTSNVLLGRVESLAEHPIASSTTPG